RRLFLELEIRDALAQRVELALELEPPFVAGSQLGSEIVVLAAFGTQRLLSLELQGQRALQASLRRGVGQARKFFPGSLFLDRNVLRLLGRSFDGALQLGLARFDRTLRELRFLRLPLQAALLLAAFGQLALGLDHA